MRVSLTFLARAVAGFGLLASSATLPAAPAQAGPSQYVFTGTASGSLNGAPFTNARISFTAAGDTGTITQYNYTPSLSDLIEPVNSPAFTLEGFGSGTLTETYEVFVNLNPRGGVGLTQIFSPGLGNDVFDLITSSLGTYDLFISFGPVSGSSTGSKNVSFATTLGDLKITAFGPATFTSAANALASLTFPASVPGGTVVTATATLAGVPPPVEIIGLSSSDPSVVRLHRGVSVPPGSSSATFTISTYRSHVTKTVTITATLGNETLTKDLTITGR